MMCNASLLYHQSLWQEPLGPDYYVSDFINGGLATVMITWLHGIRR